MKYNTKRGPTEEHHGMDFMSTIRNNIFLTTFHSGLKGTN